MLMSKQWNWVIERKRSDGAQMCELKWNVTLFVSTYRSTYADWWFFSLSINVPIIFSIHWFIVRPTKHQKIVRNAPHKFRVQGDVLICLVLSDQQSGTKDIRFIIIYKWRQGKVWNFCLKNKKKFHPILWINQLILCQLTNRLIN